MPADPAHTFAPIPRIGRRSGWQWGDLRGWMDLTIGGVGTRRGRPHPVELASGDTIDVWRLEKIVPERRLRLVAETKLPDTTWLGFEVTPRSAGSEIRQTASFAPSALLGRLYWCSGALFHQVLLPMVLERIAAAVPPPRTPSSRTARAPGELRTCGTAPRRRRGRATAPGGTFVVGRMPFRSHRDGECAMLYPMTEITWTIPPDNLRNPILVAAFRGWNDAASAASAAQSYVAGKLDAQLAGSIDPEDFYDFQSTRPHIDLTRPGAHTLTWPEVEIHIANAADRDVMFVSGAEPSMRWRTFCTLLIDAAIRSGASTVVTLGAFLADTPHTRPARLTGMSSDPELVAGLHLREPAYRGPSGIVSVFNQMSVERGLTGVSLWAPASHYAAGITNTKAAFALVRALETATKISVDLTELQAASAAYELQVSHAVEADPRLAELVRQLEAASDDDHAFDPGALPSGDELALELEQFLRDRESDSGNP